MPGWDYKGLWVYSQPVVGVPSLLPWLVARRRLHTSGRVELVHPLFGAVLSLEGLFYLGEDPCSGSTENMPPLMCLCPN